MSGTKRTATRSSIKRRLQGKEICEIIRTSHTCGVRLIQIGDLKVEFGTQTEPGGVSGSPYPRANNAVFGKPSPDLSEDEHSSQTKEALEIEELRLREQQLAQMLIEDPSRAEELLMDGELEDDGDDSADDQSE